MTTAVIISGQMRTFARCLPSMHWSLFRKLPAPSFYVSCSDDADAKSADLLRDSYPDSVVEIERVTQPKLPEPPAQLADHAPYAISSPIQAILRQLWHLSRAWNFYESKGGVGKHDLIVRLRPDLHFHRMDVPHELCEVDGTPPNTLALTNTAWIPWWDNYGGVNDRFALLGNAAAPSYFKTWDILPQLLANGCPVHPESLVCAALEFNGVEIRRTLRAEFSARRPSGELVFPKPQPGEMLDFLAEVLR